MSAAASVGLYLSYFTVLTNLLVAAALTCLSVWILRRGTLAVAGLPLRYASPLSALALYIAVVGLTYAALLRQVWNPQGRALVADTILHTLTPILYCAVWWTCVPRGRLRWMDALWWTLYPLGYFLAMLWRGSATGVYPYHFLDLTKIGLAEVARNAGLFTAGFLVLGFALIALDRAAGRRFERSTLRAARKER